MAKTFIKGMNCSKCTGRVVVDRMFSEKSHVELYCIMCGKRWMLNKEKSRFAQWLMARETALAAGYGISS